MPTWGFSGLVGAPACLARPMRGMGGILEFRVASCGGRYRPAPVGLPVVALVVMVLLLPRIISTMETSRARRLVQRSRGVDGDERQRLEQQAIEVAADRPMGLVAVAEEAIRRDGAHSPRKRLRDWLPPAARHVI